MKIGIVKLVRATKGMAPETIKTVGFYSQRHRRDIIAVWLKNPIVKSEKETFYIQILPKEN